MNNPSPEVRQDNRIQDFVDFSAIVNHNGWLIYKKELEKRLDEYVQSMNNPDAPADVLKNLQLIKRGLKIAWDIPRVLENKAKLARREKK